MQYNSYKIRTGKQELETEIENELMEILIDFGSTVDPFGFDSGDYDAAMEKLLKLVE